VSAEQVALIIISLLITVALALSGWCLRAVVELKVNLASHQGADDQREKAYERRFAELRAENSRAYGDVKEDLGELKRGVTAIHVRIDKLVTQQMGDNKP